MSKYEVKKVNEGDSVIGGIVVLPACENKHAGIWMCVTCGLRFQNQLQKDIHIENKPKGRAKAHTLAWICNEHGVEVP